MRDAWHNNEEKMYAIPYKLSAAEMENLKVVARKGTFSCSYCKAALYIRHGEINGTYFAHQHGGRLRNIQSSNSCLQTL